MVTWVRVYELRGKGIWGMRYSVFEGLFWWLRARFTDQGCVVVGLKVSGLGCLGALSGKSRPRALGPISLASQHGHKA